MFSYLDWGYIWRCAKPYVIGFIIGGLIVYILAGCAGFPVQEKQTGKETELSDPLASDKNQIETIKMYLKKYGQPMLFYSYSDSQFRVEIYYWPQSDPQRWAIKINGKYKNTWTQFETQNQKVEE